MVCHTVGMDTIHLITSNLHRYTQLVNLPITVMFTGSVASLVKC